MTSTFFSIFSRRAAAVPPSARTCVESARPPGSREGARPAEHPRDTNRWRPPRTPRGDRTPRSNPGPGPGRAAREEARRADAKGARLRRGIGRAGDVHLPRGDVHLPRGMSTFPGGSVSASRPAKSPPARLRPPASAPPPPPAPTRTLPRAFRSERASLRVSLVPLVPPVRFAVHHRGVAPTRVREDVPSRFELAESFEDARDGGDRGGGVEPRAREPRFAIRATRGVLRGGGVLRVVVVPEQGTFRYASVPTFTRIETWIVLARQRKVRRRRRCVRARASDVGGVGGRLDGDDDALRRVGANRRRRGPGRSRRQRRPPRRRLVPRNLLGFDAVPRLAARVRLDVVRAAAKLGLTPILGLTPRVPRRRGGIVALGVRVCGRHGDAERPEKKHAAETRRDAHPSRRIARESPFRIPRRFAREPSRRRRRATGADRRRRRGGSVRGRFSSHPPRRLRRRRSSRARPTRDEISRARSRRDTRTRER